MNGNGRKGVRLLGLWLVGILLAICLTSLAARPAAKTQRVQDSPKAAKTASPSAGRKQTEGEGVDVIVKVGKREFAAKFYDNPSAQVLLDKMPFTLNMKDYGGQEKVLGLSYDFPAATTVKPKTIQAGEIYLWSQDDLVLFYTSFANSYGGYVPIGYIEDVEGLAEALGDGDAKVRFGTVKK